MSSYYQTLGIEAGADKKEIKKAYFKQIRSYPPEKDPEMFKRIREAYEYLMQDENRKKEETKEQMDPVFQKVYEQALSYQEEKDYGRAIDCCLEVLRISDMEAFRFLLAKLYRDNENTGKEVKEFEALSRKYPQNAEYLFYLGSAYCHRGWWKKGLDIFEKLEEQQYRSLQFYDDYGWSLKERGFVEKATKILRQGIRYFSEQEKKVQKKETDLAGELWSVLLETDEDKDISIMEQDLCDYMEFLDLHSDQEYAFRHASLDILDETVGRADESASLSAKAALLLQRLEVLEQDYGLDKEMHQLLQAQGCFLESQRMKSDTRIPQGLKEEVEAIYKSITIKKMCQNAEEHSIINLLSDTEEDRIGFLELKLVLLEDWDQAKQLMHLLREEYPLCAEAFGDYVDEVLQGSSKTYLWRKYEKQYKKLMGYPSSGCLVRGDREDSVVFDSSEGETYRRAAPKVGRNDPCPCGSGKKYKNCCGRN